MVQVEDILERKKTLRSNPLANMAEVRRTMRRVPTPSMRNLTARNSPPGNLAMQIEEAKRNLKPTSAGPEGIYRYPHLQLLHEKYGANPTPPQAVGGRRTRKGKSKRRRATRR